MDLSSLLGVIIGFGAILGGYLLEGGTLAKLVHEPSPFIIIFGGTTGATLLSYPLDDLKKLPGLLGVIFKNQHHDPIPIINQFAELSEKARKDGLLSLEQDAQNNENEMIRKGLGLVVDGIETETIRDILHRESMIHEMIYEAGAKIFESMGAFSPTMGVCGTVLGMITILSDMSNPDELGPKIGVAFIATLLGVSFANLLYLPMAQKLKMKMEAEKMVAEIVIEGLLSIQAGENPRIIREKLSLSLLEKLSGKKPSAEAKEEG